MVKSNRIGLGKGKGKGYKNLTDYDPYVHYLAGKGVNIYQPVFKKRDLFHLPLELTLYVPSTQGKKKVISENEFRKRIEEAQQKMKSLFGGYTKVSAEGEWVDESGTPLKEPIAKVTSFTSIEDFEENKKEFEDYVKNVQKNYDQDAISIEFEGDLYFYSAKKDNDGDE